MLKVREIMTKDPITLGPDLTLREAAERLSGSHISGAPVVSGRTVLGVLSASDIVDFIANTPGVLPDERAPDIESDDDGVEAVAAFYADAAAGDVVDIAERMRHVDRPEWDVLSEHTVTEAMTHVVFSVPADATVESAADYMRRAEIHRLLVLEAGHLIGIVSTLDIATAVADHGLTARI
ncbi:MAG: CBS domain-containing protein [Gemmatimonadaceae bacterium]